MFSLAEVSAILSISFFVILLEFGIFFEIRSGALRWSILAIGLLAVTSALSPASLQFEDADTAIELIKYHFSLVAAQGELGITHVLGLLRDPIYAA